LAPTTTPPATPRASHQPPPRRHLWLWITVAAAFTAWLAYRGAGHGFQPQKFLEALQGIDWKWFSVSIAFMIATYPGRAIRWAVMLRPLKPSLRLWPLVSATVIGFGALSLFGRAGEVVRPYFIARRESVPISSQMAAWFVERILDMIVVVSLFGFALWKLDQTSAQLSPRIAYLLETGGLLICIATLVGIAVVLLARHASHLFRQRILSAAVFLRPELRDRVARFVDAIVDGMEVTRRPAVWLQLLLYTAIEWFLILASFFFLTQSFPALAHLGWLENALIVAIVALGGLITIPGVGGGLQASAILALTELFQIPLEPASSFALVLWLLSFVLVLPFAAAFALAEGLTIGQLRHLEDDPQPPR
jgi:uncharacterized protein (TIRG00374 family)